MARRPRRQAELNQRSAKIVIFQHPRRTKPLLLDAETDLSFNAQHPSRRCRYKLQIDVNRP
jgi:hypothetical protein